MVKPKNKEKKILIREKVNKTVKPITKKVPLKLKIAMDINLLDDSRMNFVREILWIEKMNKKNYKKLNTFIKKPFDIVIKAYGCDVCDKECDLKNPIYTNSENQGVDICTNCIKTIKRILLIYFINY